MLVNDFIVAAVIQEKDKLFDQMQRLTSEIQKKYQVDYGVACTIVVNSMSFAISMYLMENVGDPKESMLAVQNIIQKSIANIGKMNLEYMIPEGHA